MKTDKDKELDDLFKNGLNEPPTEAAYREEDWAALEQKLDGAKKRGGGLIFWLPILSSAAILLLLVGWWLFRPVVVNHQQKQQQAVVIKHELQNTDEIAATHKKNNPTVKSGDKTAAYAVNSKTGRHNHNNKSDFNPGLEIAYEHRKDLGSGDNKTDLTTGGDNSGKITANQTNDGELTRRDAAAFTTISRVAVNDASTHKLNNNSLDNLPKNIPANSMATLSKRNTLTKSWLGRPQYTLSFIGAPELNGVNSLQQTRSGTNFGMLFSAGFRKITFSTGAMYAVKPYSTSFNSGSYQFAKNGLTNVNADCRVLDIPINVDYALYNKHRNKFSIGSGLSSYIMLHESYQYNYTNPAVNGPVNYTVPNVNKYFFSILNLQATYTRQINSKVGLSLQPYLKLPLTGIGASEAKLQTAGIAVGLSWNLNSLSKP